MRTFGRSLAGLALAALLLAPALATAQKGPGNRPPPEVTVVTLAAQDITLTSKLPGRVVASGTAEVRPQVSGIITKRLFKEGEAVTMDQPLYQIDDATYRAAYAAARAELAQARAQLSKTEKEEDRIRELSQRKVATERNLEEAVAAREVASAAVQLADARVQQAKIDLDRTTIRAPLAGTIGRTLVSPGALVAAGQDSAMTVIRTLDPILVDVTQSAAEMLAWRRGDTIRALNDTDLKVRLLLADNSAYDHVGFLRAAEPFVDRQTGVVTLRMQFPNPDALLLPGMYVQVEMPQGVARNVVLAPQEGVTRDRRGNPQALVVNADGVVERRDLKILQARGADWIVSEGLGAGDRIIVAGLQKVAPGAPAKPVERESPVASAGAPPAASGGQAE